MNKFYWSIIKLIYVSNFVAAGGCGFISLICDNPSKPHSNLMMVWERGGGGLILSLHFYYSFVWFWNLFDAEKMFNRTTMKKGFCFMWGVWVLFKGARGILMNFIHCVFKGRLSANQTIFNQKSVNNTHKPPTPPFLFYSS